MDTATGRRATPPSAECSRCGRPRGGDSTADRPPVACARISQARGDTAVDGGRDDTCAQLLALMGLSVARWTSGDARPAAALAPALSGDAAACWVTSTYIVYSVQTGQSLLHGIGMPPAH